MRAAGPGAVALVLVALTAAPVAAQTAETTGSRALGMAGAFVAVASDSSATWWNPAGLAAGALLDAALSRSQAESDDTVPAWRETASGFTLATPPLGISHYRFRVTDIRQLETTAPPPPGREDGGAEVVVRSLAVSHLGITLVQTLISGVHAGATVKLLRGRVETARAGAGSSVASLLDQGAVLEAADTDGRIDLDIGVLAVAGPIRLGVRTRNVRQPVFGDLQLPRQTRVGVAFDPERTAGLPLVVAVDADLGAYAAPSGPRRVVALGGEYWMAGRRVGVRAGGRTNTTGLRERAVTAGASVAIRPGMYLDAHAVRGARHERGWGAAARVSF